VKNLPFLIIGSVVFLLAGVAMVTREIAGGFILIPIALIFAIRGLVVWRARSRT
jgi:hypothetical protein